MENIIIRSVTPDDAESLVGIYRFYVEHTAITFEYDVPSVDEFRRRIENTLRKYPYLAAEHCGKLVGYAYAGAFVGRAAYDWCAELSIYLDHSFTGKGLGRTLYEALFRKLKDMGILNLYACIGYPEEDDKYLTHNSIEFHKHLGFETVGRFNSCGYKFGRWYHMAWLEKIIGDHTENQPHVIWRG